MLRSTRNKNTNVRHLIALAIAVAAALLMLLFAVAGRSEAAGKLLYPDLKTIKPDNLQLDQRTNRLHFDNTVWNRGEGPLELRGRTVRTPSGKKTKVYQRVFDNKGNFQTTKALGTFVYHPSHGHFHFGGFAEYQLWTKYKYMRWQQSGGEVGRPLQEGTKTSFCVLDYEDWRASKPNNPGFPEYTACTRYRQGISVGWADTYEAHLPEQWLDLGSISLVEGKKYALRSVTDPANRIYESQRKTDNHWRESEKSNAAVTFFTIRDGTLIPE